MTAATKHVFKLEGRESTVTTSPNREVALRKSGEQGIDSLPHMVDSTFSF